MAPRGKAPRKPHRWIRDCHPQGSTGLRWSQDLRPEAPSHVCRPIHAAVFNTGADISLITSDLLISPRHSVSNVFFPTSPVSCTSGATSPTNRTSGPTSPSVQAVSAVIQEVPTAVQAVPQTQRSHKKSHSPAISSQPSSPSSTALNHRLLSLFFVLLFINCHSLSREV